MIGIRDMMGYDFMSTIKRIERINLIINNVYKV